MSRYTHSLCVQGSYIHSCHSVTRGGALLPGHYYHVELYIHTETPEPTMWVVPPLGMEAHQGNAHMGPLNAVSSTPNVSPHLNTTGTRLK